MMSAERLGEELLCGPNQGSSLVTPGVTMTAKAHEADGVPAEKASHVVAIHMSSSALQAVSLVTAATPSTHDRAPPAHVGSSVLP